MAKNIVVFLDGTWDTYKEGVSNNSNVGRMYEAAVGDDPRQMKHYTPGVGTDWYDRIKGGVAGVGTNDRIQDAYQFITDQYDDGDAVFIFGFSRGAYEARSLCGMVGRVGLLDRTRFAATNRRDMFDIVFNNYTRPKDAANNQLVANFKATNCVDAPIKMIGVWDTVGALGVPVFATQLTLFVPTFHDLSLGPRVENAYHAMSIDEQRFDFTPTYWDPATVQPGQHLEQVYFAGVHSDVGGGYDDDHSLSDITLNWMTDRARKHGLLFTSDSFGTYADDAVFGRLHDSFSPLLASRGRFHRVVDAGMTVHKSVQVRWNDTEGKAKPGAYAPVNLDKQINYDFVE
ncbi:MAG TPA: DUF2235 domain-containing protein [Thermoanaerobaculia bacterium]|jgi:uncharacterized protein (DUF2235 family)|nr:DUF2235 domain-containing protein [Thermoanaerobaculia bacterium]